jgi:hypothetical protein
LKDAQLLKIRATDGCLHILNHFPTLEIQSPNLLQLIGYYDISADELSADRECSSCVDLKARSLPIEILAMARRIEAAAVRITLAGIYNRRNS